MLCVVNDWGFGETFVVNWMDFSSAALLIVVPNFCYFFLDFVIFCEYFWKTSYFLFGISVLTVN